MENRSTKIVIFLGVIKFIVNFAVQKKETFSGGYQSGQMGQTVNLLVFTFGGSNPSPPTLKELFSIIAHNNLKKLSVMESFFIEGPLFIDVANFFEKFIVVCRKPL